MNSIESVPALTLEEEDFLYFEEALLIASTSESTSIISTEISVVSNSTTVETNWFDGLLKLLRDIFPQIFSSSDYRELTDALKDYNQSKVNAIMSQISDATPKDMTEWTPLHYACRDGNIILVRALITRLESENISIDGQSKFLKTTPLTVAALCEHEEIVQVLLEHGADTNLCVDSGGWTAIHTMSRDNNYGMMKMFIESGAELNTQTSCSQETALHIACRTGSVDAVKLLIRFGADKNLLNSRGDRPVDLASNDEIRMILSSPCSVMTSESISEVSRNSERNYV